MSDDNIFKTLKIILYQNEYPNDAIPSDLNDVCFLIVSVIPILSVNAEANNDTHNIIVINANPAAIPFQIYKPKTFKIDSIGLVTTLTMANIAEVRTNAAVKPKNMTVDKCRPALKKPSISVSATGSIGIKWAVGW